MNLDASMYEQIQRLLTGRSRSAFDQLFRSRSADATHARSLWGVLNPVLGEIAEDVAELFFDECGQVLVADHAARGKSQGIDLVVFAPETTVITLVEVKSTLVSTSNRPRITKGQASHNWFADRTQILGLEQLGLDAMSSKNINQVAVQVNFATGLLTQWALDGSGRPVSASNEDPVPVLPLIKRLSAE